MQKYAVLLKVHLKDCYFKYFESPLTKWTLFHNLNTSIIENDNLFY